MEETRESRGLALSVFDVVLDSRTYRLDIENAENEWRCKIDGRAIALSARPIAEDLISLLVSGRVYEAKREKSDDGVYITSRGVRHLLTVRDPKSLRSRGVQASDDSGPRKITAPMPGKIVRILVALDELVEAGQGIAVVEAMKMQNEIKSPKKGKVRKLLVADGSAVNAGDALAVIA